MTNPFADCDSIEEIVGQLAGAASMCWEPRPTGVFVSEEASAFVDAAVEAIRERIIGGFPTEDYKPGGRHYRTPEALAAWAKEMEES